MPLHVPHAPSAASTPPPYKPPPPEAVAAATPRGNPAVRVPPESIQAVPERAASHEAFLNAMRAASEDIRRRKERGESIVRQHRRRATIFGIGACLLMLSGLFVIGPWDGGAGWLISIVALVGGAALRMAMKADAEQRFTVEMTALHREWDDWRARDRQQAHST